MKEFEDKVTLLVNKARQKNTKLATAESCTGGLLSAAITSISGSSDVFEAGFVTYSYYSKTAFLNVPEKILNSKGAVSAEVAKIMAVNSCLKCGATIAVSITGIAGPKGGTDEKPLGTVYFGTYNRRTGMNKAYLHNFTGNRDEIRTQSVNKALDLLIEEI